MQAKQYSVQTCNYVSSFRLRSHVKWYCTSYYNSQNLQVFVYFLVSRCLQILNSLPCINIIKILHVIFVLVPSELFYWQLLSVRCTNSILAGRYSLSSTNLCKKKKKKKLVYSMQLLSENLLSWCNFLTGSSRLTGSTLPHKFVCSTNTNTVFRKTVVSLYSTITLQTAALPSCTAYSLWSLCFFFLITKSYFGGNFVKFVRPPLCNLNEPLGLNAVLI